ncbi:unnamed protein product, partial [Symbiodinium natans]
MPGFGLVKNILDTALLFVPDATRGVESSFAKRNVEFLRNYVGSGLKPRKDPGGLLLNESDIRSGDFLGVLRLDGLDPMLAWGMGSHTGHTAVAIWEDGQLYVAESTVNSSYWPTNGIQRTPYRQWITQARAAGYSTVHAPLKEEYRKTFDERMELRKQGSKEATERGEANAFFHKYEGTLVEAPHLQPASETYQLLSPCLALRCMPACALDPCLEYGYHALLTGWIDTLRNNYPHPGRRKTMERCKPPYDTPEGEKQNQHVTGSSFSNLSATELYRRAQAKGMELAEIPAVVEPDGVLYPSIFNNGTTAKSIAM